MAKSQDGGGGSNNTGSALALGAMLLIFVAMWSYYRPYMARAVVKVSLFESKVALVFSPVLTKTYRAQLIDLIKKGTPLIKQPGVKQFKTMTNRQIFQVWNIPSKFLSPLFIFTTLLMAWHVRSTDVASRFRKRYSLEDLIRAQAVFYPHLRPIMNTPIDKLPARKGPWRVKYSYMEFAVEHKLLLDGTGKVIDDENYKFKAAFFDRARAEAIFKRQLGKRWTDTLESLHPHQQAMFGVMASMVARDRPGMLAATRQMNSTWKMTEHKKKKPTFEIDCTLAIELAKKHWDHPEVAECRRSHAYFLTVMSALAARKLNAGELCISHYIWLRPTDPLLFYTLHQQGLPQPNIESAGPFVHYEIERRQGMAIPEPVIDKAIEGLKAALLDEGWISAQIKDGQITATQDAVKDFSARPKGFEVAA